MCYSTIIVIILHNFCVMQLLLYFFFYLFFILSVFMQLLLNLFLIYIILLVFMQLLAWLVYLFFIVSLLCKYSWVNIAPRRMRLVPQHLSGYSNMLIMFVTTVEQPSNCPHQYSRKMIYWIKPSTAHLVYCLAFPK